MCCKVPESWAKSQNLTIIARANHRCIFRVGAKGTTAAAIIQAEFISTAGPLCFPLSAWSLSKGSTLYCQYGIYIYPYPSCWQTTSASLMSQKSSQTVCHSPLRFTSTRPSYWLLPPTRRTSEEPGVEAWQIDQLRFKNYYFVCAEHLCNSILQHCECYSCVVKAIYMDRYSYIYISIYNYILHIINYERIASR